ncbi:MAG: Hsp20/alpha crystallin family protein [Planctomycetota bacterium]|jgi:HSP20 family protein
MAQFPFQIRQFPSALQDFAVEMENIFDQVLNKGQSSKGCSSQACSQNGCSTNGACEAPATVSFTPALDVFEDQNGFVLMLDLPGVSLENLKLELLEDKLHVSGTKAAASLADGSVLHRSERSTGNFARAIRLPKQVASQQIEANFKDGVLHIRVPKVPKPTSRTIVING